MPDKHPIKVFGPYLKMRGEVFFSMLRLGLIGGGVAGLRDFTDNGSALLNHKTLGYFGFPGERRS
jgi:hypothetical protein